MTENGKTRKVDTAAEIFCSQLRNSKNCKFVETGKCPKASSRPENGANAVVCIEKPRKFKKSLTARGVKGDRPTECALPKIKGETRES